MRARSIVVSVLLLMASVVEVVAQSSPGLTTGQVPTAAQWNSYFAAKQDVLGYPALNKAGDLMTGRLGTAASTTLNAGFNIFPGTAPTVPLNGDMWTTAAGLFARINGSTVGPLIGAQGIAGAACDGVTDDTAAIQAALNAGGYVQLPTGGKTCIIDQLTGPSGATLDGSGSTIKRKNSAVGTIAIDASSSVGFGVRNLTVDCNSANNVARPGYGIVFNSSNLSTVRNSTITNCGNNALTYATTTDGANNTTAVVNNVTVTNSGEAIQIQQSKNINVDGLSTYNVGGSGGASVYVTATPGSLPGVNGNLKFTNMVLDCNNLAGSFGMVVIGFTNSTGPIGPVLDWTKNYTDGLAVTNSTVKNCKRYGFSFQATNVEAANLVAFNSGQDSPYAGILFQNYRASITGSQVDWVGVFGLDAGGCTECTISNNFVGPMQAGSTSGGGVGINAGATQYTAVTGNNILGKGSLTYINNTESGAGVGFPWTTTALSIMNNKYTCLTTPCSAIAADNGASVTIGSNTINTSDYTTAFRLNSSNVQWLADSPQQDVNGVVRVMASASTVIIGETDRSVYLTGTTTINKVMSSWQNTQSASVPYLTLTSAGTYASTPTISFGTGCTVSPSANAMLDGNGHLTGAIMTGYGSGCSGVPSVSVSGGGGGAFTATVGLINLLNGRTVSLATQSSLTITSGSGINSATGANIVTSAGDVNTITNYFGVWAQSQPFPFPVPLSKGGTNNALTASNGGLVWSDASKLNILSGTATANLPALSGASATPSWATITYPTSATSGGIPYFSSTTGMASSALLGASKIIVGGGAGVSPHDTLCSIDASPIFNCSSASNFLPQAQLYNQANDNFSGVLNFQKSVNGGTVGNNTQIGQFAGQGFGSTQLNTMASIQFAVDGAFAGNNVPGRIDFTTYTNSNTNQIALSLKTDGGGVFNKYVSIPDMIRATGTTPGIGTCGTSPSISGSDLAGTITTGSTATTSCTITFASAKAAAPYCVATPEGAANSGLFTTTGTTTLVLSYTSATSAKFNYHCTARSGG